MGWRSNVIGRLVQLVAEPERMFHAVPDRGSAVALQPAQLAGPGAGNDGVALLGLAALEDARALENEASLASSHAADDLLEADERGRAVGAIHHQVLDVPFVLDG